MFKFYYKNTRQGKLAATSTRPEVFCDAVAASALTDKVEFWRPAGGAAVINLH